MRRVHRLLSFPDEVLARLARVEAQLNRLLAKENRTMALIDDLIANVASESTVDDSIITLLTNVVAQLKAQGAPPATLAQLQSLMDAVTANKAKVAAAVTANTPAAPPPAP
jgi:SOS response regulatory protein OraA/RecX